MPGTAPASDTGQSPGRTRGRREELAAKIRVYELARELGLSNKEALDLCISLGIGVKSHSSSIEDAQADRVRRKADADGLRRATPPEEPEAAPAPAAAVKKAGTIQSARSTTPTEQSAPIPPRPRLISSTRSPAPPPPADVRPSERPVAAVQPAPVPAAARPVPAPAAPRPAPAPAPAAPRPAPAPAPAATRPAPPATTSQPAAAAPPTPSASPPPIADPGIRPEPRQRPPRPPMSPSGRPIPPPPAVRPPLGPSGRPIPPPPGLGGRRSSPPAPASRPGSGYAPRTGGRPAGGPPGRTGGGFAGRPAGGFAGRSGPGGPVGAGSPAGRGGPGFGRGGRPPQRRARRRRRNLEELEPTQLTAYMPSNAPVPDGEIIVERGSTARDLGPKLNRSSSDVIRFLLLQGEMVTATQSLSDDMIELFAAELGAEVRLRTARSCRR